MKRLNIKGFTELNPRICYHEPIKTYVITFSNHEIFRNATKE